MLDVVLISIVLSFFTGGQLTMNLLNIEMLRGGRYTAAFFMNWFVFAAAFYLYFKYTGQTMGRSLAQRGFRSPSFTTTVRCSKAITGGHERWPK